MVKFRWSIDMGQTHPALFEKMGYVEFVEKWSKYWKTCCSIRRTSSNNLLWFYFWKSSRCNYWKRKRWNIANRLWIIVQGQFWLVHWKILDSTQAGFILKILPKPNVILVLEFETLKSNNFIQYVESLWFFERLQKFIDQKEINYTDHKVFCDILLTGLHLVNVNRFEQEWLDEFYFRWLKIVQYWDIKRMRIIPE